MFQNIISHYKDIFVNPIAPKYGATYNRCTSRFLDNIAGRVAVDLY